MKIEAIYRSALVPQVQFEDTVAHTIVHERKKWLVFRPFGAAYLGKWLSALDVFVECVSMAAKLRRSEPLALTRLRIVFIVMRKT